jgi:hypothetical protein
MLFQPKIKTVGTIREFLSSDLQREIKRFNKKAAAYGIKATLTSISGTTAVIVSNIAYANSAYAAGPVDYVKQSAKEKIVQAFMPLVDLVQALSYPIALVMLTGGALMFMINQKERGISLIQNASIGYILVQLMPLFMQLLVGIGNTVG